jgi:acyl-coenzyme A synthetase/AMP-(fatty) acid ligase
MGDLGWMDSKGRIWFCGRKSHRVRTIDETLYTIPVEAIFNNHENVFRSALAGAGPKADQTPVIFIEPVEKIQSKRAFIKELLDMGRSNPLTKKIEHIFIEKSFPVDIRHNSKIFREKLAVKAAKKLNL